jgi:hypothetical protein
VIPPWRIGPDGVYSPNDSVDHSPEPGRAPAPWAPLSALCVARCRGCRVMRSGSAHLEALGARGESLPLRPSHRLGRHFSQGHPATSLISRAAGGRARSRRFAAPAGPPLAGAFRRRRPLDGASRHARCAGSLRPSLLPRGVSSNWRGPTIRRGFSWLKAINSSLWASAAETRRLRRRPARPDSRARPGSGVQRAWPRLARG